MALASALLPSCSTPSTSRGDIPPGPAAKFQISEQARQACPDLQPVANGKAVNVAVAMAGDAVGYRTCQAGQREAVSAFDLLANAYDRLLEELAGNSKGGKKK